MDPAKMFSSSVGVVQVLPVWLCGFIGAHVLAHVYPEIWTKQNCLRVGFSYAMMTLSNGNIFRITGPLCGEFTGHRWIPHVKASDA